MDMDMDGKFHIHGNPEDLLVVPALFLSVQQRTRDLFAIAEFLGMELITEQCEWRKWNESRPSSYGTTV